MNIEQYPALLTVDNIMEATGLTKAKAYELCNSRGFPSIRIGRRLYISKSGFIKWLESPDGYQGQYTS